MRNEIVVGLDDSASSRAALTWAAEHARNVGAVLRAVHALDWPIGLTAAGFPAPVDFMNLSRTELEDSYRQKYTALFDAVSPAPDWILQFASGNPGRVLVQQAKDAQVLVVGTREHVGLGRLVSGSVSHFCLSHAVCPVIAVPPPASDRRAEVADAGALDIASETGQAVLNEAETPSRTLVVAGVDASAESLAAAHYAAKAAEMRGVDLLLLHAYASPSTQADDKGIAKSAAQTSAEKLLATVAAQLIVPPQLQSHTRAEPGDRLAVLKASAHQATLLVLGRDRVSWGERLFMGAVASQLVSHLACPLVVVPSGWRPRHASPQLPVIVALDAETAPEPALQLAFEEARLRDARLIVLHAAPMTAAAHEVTAAELHLGVVLSEWKNDHPDVAISTVIVSGDPDAQLVRWSRSAAVLVVGHPHRRLWGSWTQSVARSVMKQTHCPLIIAPQATAAPEPQRVPAERART
jgi:nucleotide-binding universal stress UspA family protein